MKRILILCTGNSARSQMAEGWLRSFDSELEIRSAGTEPAASVHAAAVAAMAEVGIDISSATPTSVSQFIDQDFDWLITVCEQARTACPALAGSVAQRIHFGFDDPAAVHGTPEQVRQAFRRVRDQIRIQLQRFYREKLGPLLRDALPQDLQPVRALLQVCGLLENDFERQFGPGWTVVIRGDVPVGAACIDTYGRFGLLRSVVVAGAHQRRGLGQLLVRNRIDWARERGIDSLFLATATAVDFFARNGFREVPRLAVPIEIRTLPKFEGSETDNSTVMEFRIR
ncbi:MAG: GNAT family N-acetyltransferase [Bryobacterales bacterium]|nr:GNAT family N-acetyltransferase [Bryobacterales bacterium]